MGATMEEGTIITWYVSEGDHVKPGDILLELETDKATIEVPSSVSGAVKEIHIRVGDKVKIGQTVLVVEAVEPFHNASADDPCPFLHVDDVASSHLVGDLAEASLLASR